MSVSILLDNRPEFYTNLDVVTGRVVLSISRPENIGSIAVKLEGEAKTAVGLPSPHDEFGQRPRMPPPGAPPGTVGQETHKILYQVKQVFPDDSHSTAGAANTSAGVPGGAVVLDPGRHEFPFRFKIPFNNGCGDPRAMAKLGNLGGLAVAQGLFGVRGPRVMDGTKQLFLMHTTTTLPPSLTGFPGKAEIRYYVKATVQRPGLLKENWRMQLGFKFMPIEPMRPRNRSEAYARRSFVFSAKSPALGNRRKTFFGSSKSKQADDTDENPPSLLISARIPNPPTLTCNQPIPLRLTATKKADTPAEVYLTSLQVDIIGTTTYKCHAEKNKEVNRWIVLSRPSCLAPLTQSPSAPVDSTCDLDPSFFQVPLPNQITPSFKTCNIERTYQLELKLGVTWGKPPRGAGSSSRPWGPSQTISLPLLFADVKVYSGIEPPPALVSAMSTRRPNPRPPNRRSSSDRPPPQPPRPRPSSQNLGAPPALPPRPGQSAAATPAPQAPGRQDSVYPPQLMDSEPAYDDAPPSYDEAMAEGLLGPFDGTSSRPAFSGVTNENAPEGIPDKP